MRRIRVVRGAKNMTWRQALAVSPIVFNPEKTLSIKALSRITGIDPGTLRKILAPLTAHRDNLPPLLRFVGNRVRLDQTTPRSFYFRVSSKGIPHYFWVGVRGAECKKIKLTPAENLLYWWFRHAVEIGNKTFHLKGIAALTLLSEGAVHSAVKRLGELGWLARDKSGKPVLQEIDLEKFYPPSALRRTKTVLDLLPCVGDPLPEVVPTEPKPKQPRKPRAKKQAKPEPHHVAVLQFADVGDEQNLSADDQGDFMAELLGLK